MMFVNTYMDRDDMGGSVLGPDSGIEELLPQVGDGGLVAVPKCSTLISAQDSEKVKIKFNAL